MAFTYRAKGSIIFKILLSFKAAMETGCAPGQLIQPGFGQAAKGVFLSFFPAAASSSLLGHREAGRRADVSRPTHN